MSKDCLHYERKNYSIFLDIDECMVDACHPNATCVNKIGSFDCNCDEGFVGEGLDCQGTIIVKLSQKRYTDIFQCWSLLFAKLYAFDILK